MMNKAEFREQCIKFNRSKSRHNSLYKEHLLNDKLLNFVKKSGAKNVLIYIPFGFEVNISPLIKELRKSVNLFAPFMEGDSFKMVTFRHPLKKKKYGIYEPGNSLKNINKIDIAIIPIIGLDREAKRVGYGKGMYDRFFEQLNDKPIKIFIQPCLCMTDLNVCDAHDIDADFLITPEASYRKTRIKNVERSSLRRWYSHSKRSRRLFCL